MAVLDEEKLDEETRNAIIDRLEAWELVEFLQLSSECVVDAFEEEIVEALDDILELIGLINENNNDED